MKINLGKLLSILSQVMVAVPTIVSVVKPILKEVKGAKKVPVPASAPDAATSQSASSA